MAECQPCYRAGHLCPATGEANTFPDGIAKCAFCEDDVECPKTRDARLAAERAIAHSRQREERVQTTKSRVPQHKPTAAFPEDAAQQENEAMKTCKCGCGKTLGDKAVAKGWEYAYGHRPAKAATSEAPKKSPAKVAKKKSAATVVAPVVNSNKDNGEERTVATLVFSQKQLTNMFAMLPFEDQVSCLQAYVDRVI